MIILERCASISIKKLVDFHYDDSQKETQTLDDKKLKMGSFRTKKAQ